MHRDKSAVATGTPLVPEVGWGQAGLKWGCATGAEGGQSHRAGAGGGGERSLLGKSLEGSKQGGGGGREGRHSH